MSWPGGKGFAFTIFDDPDGQSLAESRVVYSFLADLGLRTTKAVWPMAPIRTPNSGGETCGNPDYLAHVIRLQEVGFEIAYHNATVHSATREETIQALDLFHTYFGRDPSTMANHYNEEAIYWGEARVTGRRRFIYNLLTRRRNVGKHSGHVEGHPSFWGDVCRLRVTFCRNFVFSNINTLSVCPWMPYYDPERPYVAAWFSASEGSNCATFCAAIHEAHQNRLEEQGGACIMYTHFGHGYFENGHLNPQFRRLMHHLSRKNAWFVPARVLLGYLRQQRGNTILSDRQRSWLESRWLQEKIFRGTS